MKIKCVESRVNVHILVSTSVLFTLTAVQVPNLALTHTPRITVCILIDMLKTSLLSFAFCCSITFMCGSAYALIFSIKIILYAHSQSMLPPLTQDKVMMVGNHFLYIYSLGSSFLFTPRTSIEKNTHAFLLSFEWAPSPNPCL